MIYHVTIGGRRLAVELGGDGVTVDGKPVSPEFERLDDGSVRSLLIDGVSHRIVARRTGSERWDLHVGGRRVLAEVVDERTRVIREMTGAGAGPKGPKPIVAPMPGMVVRIEVEEGEVVQAGQGVVIVEAMKMENELTSEGPGVVTRVHVAEGQAVEKGQPLVDLGAVEGEGEAAS
jgi:pyruvate carboxylase subunit B